MKKSVLFAMAATLVVAISCTSDSPSSTTAKMLEEGFNAPPSKSRPRVWWHWMNGNITKDGIRKDLDWMESVGIAGFQNFDAALQTPTVVENRLAFMTPEWKEAFSYMVDLASSKGMEMAIAGSPGWSESGGPWVEPHQAMKKIVWSEIDVLGKGNPVQISLPHPPTVSGTFQGIAMAQGGGFSSATAPPPSYYEDIAVIAMKMPSSYVPLNEIQAKLSSSSGTFTKETLSDGDYQKASTLPYGKPGNKSWIQYEFSSPQTIYGVEVSTSGGNTRGMGGNIGSIEISDDGKTFTKVSDLTPASNGVSATSFSAVTSKYIRLCYTAPDPNAAPAFAGFGPMMGPSIPPKGIDISEFKLFNTPRVNRFIDKAGFSAATGLSDYPTPEVDKTASAQEIVDVTDKMKEDGSLDWSPSEGYWKILRFGYSLTGRTNHPATAEATGLEVDKLSAAHSKDYFTKYVEMYKEATGGAVGGKGIHYIITDSWEAGCLNWTDKMFEDFSSMRGYDLHKWLPAIAGYVVDNAKASDNFLWDYRKTIAELTAKNHYDLLSEVLEEYDMARYSESHENGRAFVADGMEVKRSAAVPMSAMWVGGLGQSGADIRESSSVSHIYGQKYVAAESLTAGGNAWGYVPETLKPTADWLMANGLNRFVIHESAHQPLDDYKPGLTLGPFGQWFNRHETWSGAGAKAWMDYMGRSCFLLQQGNYVADILYFYGEGQNITAQYGNALPDIPRGYNFDFVNADAIVNVIGVKDGRLTTPAGTNYSILVLDPVYAKEITVPVLKKMCSLVENGATILGNAPTASPSLSDDPEEFRSLVSKMWGTNGSTSLGKGKVIIGTDMKAALESIGVKPDIDYAGESDLKYLHRSIDGIHIYWILNRTNGKVDADVAFNVSGLQPEIWDAVYGTIERPSYSTIEKKVVVPMHFEPNDAFFIVFRSKGGSSYSASEKKVVSSFNVEGDWNVAFIDGMDAPSQTTFATLSDWTKNSDPQIKYYSGTTVYTNTFNMDSIEEKVILDLGEVHDIADVFVNGKNVGTLWKSPFTIDVTEAVKTGSNTLEIHLTNMWANRIIGDLQPGQKQYTHTSQHSYNPASPLKPSGLIGPVKVELCK